METQLIIGNTAAKAKTGGFTAMVEKAYNSSNSFKGYNGTLGSVLRNYFSTMSTSNNLWKRETFRMLLLHMYNQGCYAVVRNPDFIEVLANISAFGNKTVRDIEQWRKTDISPEKQLSSLLQFCFATYKVPEFMEFAFSSQNKIHMLWYIQLGRGDSVRQLSGFPVKFTAAMAHHFRFTPPDYTIERAIRRAQALGYGACAGTAEAIAWSILSDSFINEVFWSTVVRIIAVQDNPAFDKIQQVLQYIAETVRNDSVYTMNGRTWNALIRQSDAWHIQMAKRREAENFCQWNNTGIRDFTLHDDEKMYRIIQLTNSVSLYDEGCEMAHCVADYTDDCMDGTAAIYSLRAFYKNNARYDTLATIEVDINLHEIVQAKARYNDNICDKAITVIKQWAVREKLAVNCDDFNNTVVVYNNNQAVITAGTNNETPVWVKVLIFLIILFIRFYILGK